MYTIPGYFTDEETKLVDYHIYWLGESFSQEVQNKFVEICENHPMLALYLAENDFLHLDHMCECIYLKALAKGTRYEHNQNLDFVLSDKSKGEHTIKINTSCYDDMDFFKEIKAYHISLCDLSVIKYILQMESCYGDKSEGSEYQFKEFLTSKEIELKHCYASEYISSNESIIGNHYREDCDTWGTQLGQKAQEAFIFWVKETSEYFVVYHSYWCL